MKERWQRPGAFPAAAVASRAVRIVELRPRHFIRFVWQRRAANAADVVRCFAPGKCRARVCAVAKRGYGLQVSRNRLQIRVIQITKAIVDGDGHKTGGLRLFRCASGTQVVHQILLAPPADSTVPV